MKMFKRMISLVMALSIILSLNTADVKADSAYSMIAPGYSADSAAAVPVDGKDYVATIDSEDTDNLYFKFEVPENSNAFYTVTYKNLSVNGRMEFSIETSLGEYLYGDEYVYQSETYARNRKLEPGCYILKIKNCEHKTGNVKVCVASRDDSVGDDLANAQGINLGKTVVGTLDGYNDNDYYKFVAPAKGTYEFYAKNLSIDTDCHFAAYSSSEERMFEEDYISKNEDKNGAVKCEKGDVYYIRYSYHYASEEPKVGKYKICVKKVGPGKVKTLKVKEKGSNNNIYASWSKASGSTGYEMQVSTDKKFKIYDSYTTSSRNYNLYRYNGTYYIRVRSYKQVGNTKYYGSFSSVKKITLK